jgi:hypothetical protein
MEEEAVSVAEVLDKIRTRLAQQIEAGRILNRGDHQPPPSNQANIEHLRELLIEVQALHAQVAVPNPRPSGVFNDLVQQFKKVLLRMLRWYSYPIVRYQAVNVELLGQVIVLLERQEAWLKSLEGKAGLATDDLADLRQRTLGKLDEIGNEVEKMARERR